MWRNYATFSGRTSRSGYWLAVLVNIVVTVLITLPFTISQELVLIALPAVYGLAVLIPGIALVVRRLHDTGRSGGWYFISFIPLIGALWLLVLMCSSGNEGANEYGPDPKQPAPYAPANA